MPKVLLTNAILITRKYTLCPHGFMSLRRGMGLLTTLLFSIMAFVVADETFAQAPLKEPGLKWFGRWALAIEASERSTKPLMLLVEGAQGIEPGFVGYYEDVFKDAAVLRLLQENFIVMKGLPAVSDPTELQGMHQITSGQSQQINFYMPSAASDPAEKEKPVLVINEEKKIVEFETHLKSLIPAARPDEPQDSPAPEVPPHGDPEPVELIVPPKVFTEGLFYTYGTDGRNYALSESFFLRNGDEKRERHILVLYGWDDVEKEEDEEFTSHYLDLMLEDAHLNQVLLDNFFVFRMKNVFGGGGLYPVVPGDSDNENIKAGAQLILLEPTNEKIEGAYSLDIVSRIVKDRKSASELHRWLCQSAGIPYVSKTGSNSASPVVTN